MGKQQQRRVSAIAEISASWEPGGEMAMEMPTVSLYGDIVTVTDMEPREQIMLWMRLLEEIEEKVCALEDESGLDRDDVINVAWWRIEPFDPTEGLDDVMDTGV